MTYYHPNNTLYYKLEDNKHELTWALDDFLTIANRNDTFILRCETEYVVNIIQEKQFKLKIEFKDVNTLHVYLLYQKPIIINEGVLFVLNVLRANDRIAVKHIKDGTVKANEWNDFHSFTLQDIRNACPHGDLKLKFCCSITSNESKDIIREIKVPTNHLSNNLKDLLTDSMFSDVTLKSVDGFEFKVHKAILSSRSTVLKAHFVHDTLENKLNIVQTNLDKEVLNEVLTYIYTNTTSMVQEIPEKILDAAEFYNLSGLKEICEYVLYSKLTADNAIETLKLADLYSATSLKQWTLEFIKDSHVDLLIKTLF